MSTPNRSFKIHGMDCAEEIAVLKREVGPLVGGEANLAFDLLNGKMILSEGASASSGPSAPPACRLRNGLNSSLGMVRGARSPCGPAPPRPFSAPS